MPGKLRRFCAHPETRWQAVAFSRAAVVISIITIFLTLRYGGNPYANFGFMLASVTAGYAAGVLILRLLGVRPGRKRQR